MCSQKCSPGKWIILAIPVVFFVTTFLLDDSNTKTNSILVNQGSENNGGKSLEDIAWPPEDTFTEDGSITSQYRLPSSRRDHKFSDWNRDPYDLSNWKVVALEPPLVVKRSRFGFPIIDARLKAEQLTLFPLCRGDLNSQRGTLLNSLVIGKLWGANAVVMPQSELQLTNIFQSNLYAGLTYNEPYSNVVAVQGSVYIMATGSFGDLWDEAHFKSTLSRLGLEVVEDQGSLHDVSVEWIEGAVQPWPAWDVVHEVNNLTAWLPWSVASQVVLRVTASKSKNVSLQTDSAKVRVLAPTDEGLATTPSLCHKIPHCIELLKAFKPTPKLSPYIKQVVDFLMSKSPLQIVALFWNELTCSVGQFEPVEAAGTIAHWLKTNGLSTSLIYLVGSQKLFRYLTPYFQRDGVQVYSKFSVFSKWLIPMEAGSQLDFEVSKIAKNVIAPKAFNTWVEYVKVYRHLERVDPSTVVTLNWGCR